MNLDETVYGSDILFPVNALAFCAADSKLDKLRVKSPMAAKAYVRCYPNHSQLGAEVYYVKSPANSEAFFMELFVVFYPLLFLKKGKAR